MNKQANIELNQGVDHKGRTFGYDHARKNFITWEIVDGKITVAAVENDEEETGHGSIKETTREAKAIAAAENRKEYSHFKTTIAKGFQRD